MAAARPLGERWPQRQTEQFDDPFALDDGGSQHVLHLHPQSSPIPHSSPVVPADQLRQLALNAPEARGVYPDMRLSARAAALRGTALRSRS